MFYKLKGADRLVQYTDGVNHPIVFKINGIKTQFAKSRGFGPKGSRDSVAWKRIYLKPGKYNIKLENEDLKCERFFIDKL